MREGGETMTARDLGKARWLAAALGLACAAWGRPAAAQRGQDFAPAEELAVSPNPNQGFPGLFDAEVAPKGALVANLPATALYYGVTPRLTIGTLAFSYASAVVGPPGASLEARYLLGGGRWFRSTFDALMGSTTVGSGSRLRLGSFTSNTEVVLNRSNRLTANGWLIRGTIDSSDSSANGTLTAFLVGATYSLALADWAALHVTALYIASVKGSLDAPTLSVDLDAADAISTANRVLTRATVSMRRGRWLFDVGLVHVGGLVMPLPWFNLAVQMGA
jgi:hypothetical protein